MPPRIPLRAVESALSRPGPSRVTRCCTPGRHYSAGTSSSAQAAPAEPQAAPAELPKQASPNDLELSRARQNNVPPLPRPLGIDLRPMASPKTYQKESNTFFDSERNKAERKVLMEQASQGYFHDYNRASKGLGKHWVAPKVLIREDKALYFPNIAGTSLEGDRTCSTELLEGKTSLVAIVSTRLSEEHVQSFIKATMDDQAGSNLNLVQINHQENHLKGAMISFFTSGLKRTVPEELWSKYFISKGRWSELDVSRPMGIDNKIVGYVYLVDKNCKIRWAGCGIAFSEEVESLRAATAVLLSRSDKQR